MHGDIILMVNWGRDDHAERYTDTGKQSPLKTGNTNSNHLTIS
ncbi:hypothetical protein [Candidatus Kuenenia stuttgartiensis]|nr:hypothetical protein [Candidatus Kuenenia stuttgartiensis]